MVERVGSRETRKNLARMLGRVRDGGQVFIVESSGKPMAAMVPVEMYERMMAERAARFQVLDRVRARMLDVPEEDVVQDVAEALAAARELTE